MSCNTCIRICDVAELLVWLSCNPGDFLSSALLVKPYRNSDQAFPHLQISQSYCSLYTHCVLCARRCILCVRIIEHCIQLLLCFSATSSCHCMPYDWLVDLIGVDFLPLLCVCGNRVIPQESKVSTVHI